jgi:hypothetical protein
MFLGETDPKKDNSHECKVNTSVRFMLFRPKYKKIKPQTFIMINQVLTTVVEHIELNESFPKTYYMPLFQTQLSTIEKKLSPFNNQDFSYGDQRPFLTPSV